MLLSEPPRTQGDLHFTLFGTPVRVSPFFWLLVLLLGIHGVTDPATLLIWIGTVFVSILVHEFGHAMAFRFYGWGARIVLYWFGGLAIREQGYTDSYSASSYAPSLHSSGDEDGWPQINISAAGPAAGFFLAGLIIAGLYLAGAKSSFLFGIEFGRGEVIQSPNLRVLVSYMLYINIMWGAINLLPVYPLDGGRISRELLLLADPKQGIRRSLVLSMVTAGVFAAISILWGGRFFVGLMFGYFAYSSYTTLQAYLGRGGGFGGFGGRRDR